jgi:hypothetical protein
MRALGTIVRLQVQRSSLKTGVSPLRVYDPEPILAVGQLAVGPDGVFGLGPDGGWIVDVHHRSHPDTKNQDGQHGISIGFSGHYHAMRDRLGERVELGCAGENIIVETPGRLTLDELLPGVAVVSPTGEELLRLTVLDVAHPCRPFTGWAVGGMVESDVLKAHLQFLEGGMRGFLCMGERAGIISVGDQVAVLESREAGSEKREA